ncbi:MAG: MoaD/ThiS family protein [Promethearchaeota archaeon]
MSLQVKLYGDLKKKVKHKKVDVGAPTTLNIKDESIEIVTDILKKLGIRESEISHIFVNGKYSKLGRKVKNGDRIGLFPKRMALIFLEIAVDKYISVNIKLEGDLNGYDPDESVIELPEGSTVASILKKYNISNEKNNLKIIVNGKPCYENNIVLKDGDSVFIIDSND